MCGIHENGEKRRRSLPADVNVWGWQISLLFEVPSFDETPLTDYGMYVKPLLWPLQWSSEIFLRVERKREEEEGSQSPTGKVLHLERTRRSPKEYRLPNRNPHLVHYHLVCFVIRHFGQLQSVFPGKLQSISKAGGGGSSGLLTL